MTRKIQVWKPPTVFEHEWKVEPRTKLPSGEDAIIPSELRGDGNGTVLHLEQGKLNTQTAFGFAPGTHAFIDRLEAQLGKQLLPNWQERYQQVALQYPPSWTTRRS